MGGSPTDRTAKLQVSFFWGSLHVLNPWYLGWWIGTTNAEHFCMVRPCLRYFKRNNTARSKTAHSNGGFSVQKAGSRIWQMAWGALGLMARERPMTRMCTMTTGVNHTSLTRPEATVRILCHSVSQYNSKLIEFNCYGSCMQQVSDRRQQVSGTETKAGGKRACLNRWQTILWQANKCQAAEIMPQVSGSTKC